MPDKAGQSPKPGTSDLKVAETNARRSLQISPRDPTLLTQLGDILGLQGRFKEATVFFLASLKLNPNDLVTRRNLAANQWQLGELPQAQQNLERILRLQPGDQQALLLLGMVAENRQKYTLGAKMLTQVPDLVRQRPESLAALAHCLYKTGRRDEARSVLLENDGSGTEGIFLAGKIAFDSTDFDTAAQLFQLIQTSYPDSLKIAQHLAEAQFRGHHPEASTTTLLTVINSGHRSSEVYNLLAWCYERQEKMREAVQAMDEAIALEPQNPDNYLDLAVMLNAHQIFRVALAAAERAVAAAPRSMAAYRIKAQIETKLYASFDEAARTYRLAIDRNPDSPDMVRAFAVAQWDNRMLKEAAATFELGLKRFPRNALLRQDFGRMLLNQMSDLSVERKRGIALLQSAVGLDDKLPEAHFELGKAELAENHVLEGVRHLETAALLNPRDSKIHYRLATAYQALGRTADATRESELFAQLKEAEDKQRVGPSKLL